MKGEKLHPLGVANVLSAILVEDFTWFFTDGQERTAHSGIRLDNKESWWVTHTSCKSIWKFYCTILVHYCYYNCRYLLLLCL